MKRIKITLGYLAAVLCLIAFDQWTKRMAVTHLKGQAAFPVIEGVFELSYLENTGMAWGLLAGGRYLFLAGSVIVFLLITYAFFKAPLTKRFVFMRIILAVLLAGAVGNFIDRLLRGYVVDFFSFCLIHFPIFNVADCYVVGAGIAFAVFFLFYYKEEELSYFIPEWWKRRKDK